jgi:hypothetical protein
MDMPDFSGLQLRLTWDPVHVRGVRVSPQPWLFNQPDPMGVFKMQAGRLDMGPLGRQAPPWRMVVGKWHFRVLEEGDAVVRLWQGATLLDTITLTLRNPDLF